MAASTRIRGQEVTLQMVVNGQLKAGSFTQVESFKWTPRDELSESDFMGEHESENDFMHHGVDFNFVCHEKDSAITDLYLTLVENDRQGLAHPVINMIAIYKYRDQSQPSKTLLFQNCVVKLDDSDFGDRKSYVKNSFSGKCKRVVKL